MTKETKSPDQDFSQLYLNKDYKAAADYLLRNKQLFSSGTFHYNLGTTYSKLGDQAAARYHLEKSIQEGHINSSTINNLNYIKSKLEVDDLTNSNSFLDQSMDIATAIPFSLYLFTSLILLFVFFIFLRINKFKNRIRLALIMVIALCPLMFYAMVVSHLHPAIVFKDISLQEGPSKIFAEKGKVKAGSKILVGDFKDGWFFVKHPESLIGWVTKDQLGFY